MTVSLVIPAYNEEGRLPAFLGALREWLTEHAGAVLEILVVDDGSTDNTSAIAARYGTFLPLRVIRFERNRGKGAAVQAGVRESRGDVVIFMDADGATPPTELPKMLEALARVPIAVGNRWMPGSQVTERELLRALSGWVNRLYVRLFGLGDIDTMCGFKGFRADSARRLFERLHDERWLFDTEVMLRARRLGMPIAAVPISWTSKHGSKLRPTVLIRAAFQIPFLVARVRREPKQTPWHAPRRLPARLLVVTALPPERSSFRGRLLPLARALARAGHDVEILSLSGAERGPFLHQETRAGVRSETVGPNLRATTTLQPSLWSLLTRGMRGYRALTETLRHRSADVVILAKPQFQNTLPALRFARRHRIPLVLDLDDLEAEASRLFGPLRWLPRWLEQHALRQAQAITACSPFLVTYAQRVSPQATVLLLPTGLSIPPHLPRVGLRERASIPDKHRVLLYIGSLSLASGHRIDTLLEVFSRLRSERTDVHLVLAGSGLDEERLRTFVQTSPSLRSAVHFWGAFTPPEDLALAREADVLVDPVDQSPTNVAKSSHRVMLALATGTPVVAGNVGIRPFLLPPDTHGTSLYDLKSPDDFIRKLRSALSGDQRSRFHALIEGRLEPWTWEHLGRTMSALVESLVQPRGQADLPSGRNQGLPSRTREAESRARTTPSEKSSVVLGAGREAR